MSTIVAVEGFKLKGKHGVFDYEREKEQPFVVSIGPCSKSLQRMMKSKPEWITPSYNVPFTM